MTTPVDLTLLHVAIQSELESFFAFAQVDCYSNEQTIIPTPSLFFQLDSIQPEDDPGTEQLACTLNFSAQIVFDFQTLNSKLGVRVKAAEIANFIYGRRWGQPVGPAKITEIASDGFEGGEGEPYSAMRVEWTHTAYLGNSIWDGVGDLPTEVLASIEPKTGIPHEPDYIPLQQ